jgi:hypothetical protein
MRKNPTPGDTIIKKKKKKKKDVNGIKKVEVVNYSY